MHQALYRKYRPKSFDDVYGQEHITSTLRYEAQMNKFSHAYLFCGPRGTGKTTCAKILAKTVNCENPVNGEPCGKCFACRSIDEGNATDVLEMDAASNTGVDYIRDIKSEVSFSPASLKKRVYIIDEVHMLSIGAFNALLKTLEEPPEHVIFILATTEFHKLPATIVSRCQRFDFRRIKSDVIAKRLLYIADCEKISLDENAASIIAKQSLGGMRDAISLLELCAAGGRDVTAESVIDILGLTTIEILYKSAVAVAKGDISAIFKVIEKVSSSSKDLSVYLSELTEFWRNMLIYKYLPEGERSTFLDFTEPEMKLLSDAARRFSGEALTYHFNLLDTALKEMARLPQTKRLTAELTLIKMSDPSLESSPASLLTRISALEEKIALLESGVTLNKTSVTETKMSGNSAESESPKAAKPADEVKSGEKSAQESGASDMTAVPDFTEALDRIAVQNPQLVGFLANTNCFVSRDGTKVVIRTDNGMAKSMLSTDTAKQSILSSFILSKICVPGAEVKIETGEVVIKRQPIDDLVDL